jgi:hypothetical protein
LEGGALLTEEFKKFSNDYVMFLHVTTRIEGRKDDDLLRTVGGRGFPHLCMLDEDGNVIATHRGPRDVTAFQGTAARAVRFMELKAKAQAGDREARIEFAIQRADMGQLKRAELEQEIAGLGELTPEQDKALKGVLANLMYEELRMTALAERLLAMEKEGLIPSDEQKQIQFYDTLVQYASYKKDPGLYEKALDKIEPLLEDNPRGATYLKLHREQLESLKASAE